MINNLIYIFMFTWLYIIYYNIFCNKTFYLLNDENNIQYTMINIFNIVDSNLFDTLFEKLYSLNYFDSNELIGLKYNDLEFKEILLVIPYDFSYITNNTFMTCNKTKLIPYEINGKNKKQIKNFSFNLNNELYLKNIYNYENKIPIYLLSKYINEIKVNLEINYL